MLDFDDVKSAIIHIPQAIKTGKGGLNAQLLLAPEQRKKDLERFENSSVTARMGAVLILVFPFHNEPYVCLMRRPTYEGVHSGQIAFPGGKKEDQDQDLYQTALREAKEEVNIDASIVLHSHALTPLYIPPSNFLVHPFIAYSDQIPNFIADPSEVEEILYLPLKEIWEEERIQLGAFKSGNFVLKDYPFYQFSVGNVWGATAMIISEIAALLNPDKISFQSKE